MSSLEYETKLWQSSVNNICGIDEVGRGCLAGPVYSGAVILNKKSNFDSENFELINDSKKLSEKKRVMLFNYLKGISDYAIGICSSKEIDEIGIQEAVKLSMLRAVNNLQTTPEFLLIDSMQINIDIPQKSIIRGDQKSKSISAASIVAKVKRDNYMKMDLAKRFPKYKFENNKGYGTKDHINSINSYGVTEIHRRSFEPIKSMIKGNHERN
ncbi:MAG: ribonuclease HII [Chloroflexota bacterium]|nr:ribonuclease HII [Chloroflexota bacterium]